MVDPSISQFMAIGSFLIAVVSTVLFGVVRGKMIGGKSLFSRKWLIGITAGSLFLQVGLWWFLSDATVSSDGGQVPVGTGPFELVAALFDQGLSLGAASWFVRVALDHNSSMAKTALYGAAAAPFAFVVSSILSVLLSGAFLIGCISSLLSCKT